MKTIVICILFGSLIYACKDEPFPSCSGCKFYIQNGSDSPIKIKIDGVSKYTIQPGVIKIELLSGDSNHHIEGDFQTAYAHTDYDKWFGCSTDCTDKVILMDY
jgi:hypothetical protein